MGPGLPVPTGWKLKRVMGTMQMVVEVYQASSAFSHIVGFDVGLIDGDVQSCSEVHTDLTRDAA